MNGFSTELRRGEGMSERRKVRIGGQSIREVLHVFCVNSPSSPVPHWGSQNHKPLLGSTARHG